jgi:hypothetical protein
MLLDCLNILKNKSKKKIVITSLCTLILVCDALFFMTPTVSGQANGTFVFIETGLPTGTSWTISLWNRTGVIATYIGSWSSTSNMITVDQPLNQYYQVDVGIVSGYRATTSTNIVNLNTAGTTNVNVTFNKIGAIAVKANDTLIYDVLWVNNNTNTLSIWPTPNNQYNQLSIKVNSVSGDGFVRYTLTQKYVNGSTFTGNSTDDLETGGGNLFFCYSNLSINDLIAPNVAYRIDKTVSKTYPDGTRDLNHISNSVNQSGFLQTLDYYYDKVVGVTVDQLMQLSSSNASGSLHLILRESNLWVVSAFSPVSLNISAVGSVYNVSALSNSTVSGLNFNQTSNELTFSVNGTSGTTGFCNITIPAQLMSGTFSIYRDNVLLVNNIDYTQNYNGTHYILSLNYSHSSHSFKIVSSQVIPESPQILAFVFVVTAIFVGTALFKKKQSVNKPGRHFSECSTSIQQVIPLNTCQGTFS